MQSAEVSSGEFRRATIVPAGDIAAGTRSTTASPMRSGAGRATPSGIPERQTHDYARHGVTCLFAALEVATGTVTDACYPGTATRSS